MVCQPPWSSRRRNNHCRRELGKRSDSQIKGLICFRRWLCMTILQTCILPKGKQQLARVPPSISGSHLPRGSFPPSLNGASALAALCSQPAPVSGLQSSAGGAAAPTKAHWAKDTLAPAPSTSSSKPFPARANPHPIPHARCHRTSVTSHLINQLNRSSKLGKRVSRPLPFPPRNEESASLAGLQTPS